MIIVTYDISNDKLRTQFSKYLSKYGYRLQYSVFEIRNSERILDNIQIGIRTKFEKHFTEADSIIIFQLGASCKRTLYGSAKRTDEHLIII